MSWQTRFAITAVAYGVGMIIVGVGLGLLFLTQTQIDRVIHRLFSPMLVVGIFGALIGTIGGVRDSRIQSRNQSWQKYISQQPIGKLDTRNEYRMLFYVICALILGFVLWNYIITQDLAQMASNSMLVLIPFGVLISMLFGSNVAYRLIYRQWSK